MENINILNVCCCCVVDWLINYLVRVLVRRQIEIDVTVVAVREGRERYLMVVSVRSPATHAHTRVLVAHYM
jgi:hypothetical protein